MTVCRNLFHNDEPDKFSFISLNLINFTIQKACKFQQFFYLILQQKEASNQNYIFFDNFLNNNSLNPIMSKNFRSSKNLKHIPQQSMPQQKQDFGHLKIKIKGLEEQVQLLKKTNLNIYIPISQKSVISNDKQHQDELIRKLRIQLLKQQQENQSITANIKKLEKEKQIIKSNYEYQIKKLKEQITQANLRLNQLQQQKNQLSQKYQNQKQKKQQIQKQCIETKVELKFLKQDFNLFKFKYQQCNHKFNSLKSLILNVDFYTKIYQADTRKITAIQTQELNNLKNSIIKLEQQLQTLLYKLTHSQKQEKSIISFNIKTQNVAEEIVRLKQNIDLQLGFKGDDSVVKSFLNKYTETNNKFKQLINGCKTSSSQRFAQKE